MASKSSEARPAQPFWLLPDRTVRISIHRAYRRCSYKNKLLITGLSTK